MRERMTLEEKNKLLWRRMNFGGRRVELALVMDSIRTHYMDLFPNDKLRKRFLKLADEWKALYTELLTTMRNDERRG